MPRIRPIEHVASKISKYRLSNSPQPPYQHANLSVLSSKPNASNYLPENHPHKPSNAFISPPQSKEKDFLRLISVKDNICTTEYPTTCASAVLKDFYSPYDATVVKLLKESGATIHGKTNMDEFGMGSHSSQSYFGPVRTPTGLSAGGSSGGSAVVVRQGEAWAALGTDTGGSVRLPAAYSGVYGFKPSYGRLSRWGVVSYANSLDTVGIFAKRIDRLVDVYGALNHYDSKDPTSMTLAIRERSRAFSNLDTQPRALRIGVPKEYNISELSDSVREVWTSVLERFQSSGNTLVPISLPTTRHALSAYYVLAPAEASSNLAKYDGVRYGTRANPPNGPDGVLFSQTRSQGFGDEVKRRILLGSYTLSAEAIDNYFIQAQKIRRLVQEDYNRVFRRPNPISKNHSAKINEQGVDFIICPTAPTPPPTLSEVEKQSPIQSYMNDVFTVPASLAGLPAISIPSKALIHDKRDVAAVYTAGIQVIGQYGDDSNVLSLAEQSGYFVEGRAVRSGLKDGPIESKMHRVRL